MSEKKVGKRLLTWVLVLVMTLSLLPLNVLADEGGEAESQMEQTISNDDFSMTKSATPNGDGSYNITLSVTPLKPPATKPLELVILLDLSGSMAYCPMEAGWFGKVDDPNYSEHVHYNDYRGIGCTAVDDHKATSRIDTARNAINNMVSELQKKGVVFNLSVVKFADVYDAAAVIQQKPIANQDDVNFVASTLSSLTPNGGTYMVPGLNVAASQFTSDPATEKVFLMLADGKYNDTGEGVLWDYTSAEDRIRNAAAQIKNKGATAYTIGFAADVDILKDIASDPSKYSTAGDAATLDSIFAQITEEIKGVYVTDTMGTDVSLCPSTAYAATGNGTATETNGSITWNLAKPQQNEAQTLTYTVTPNLRVGRELYNLNGETTLHCGETTLSVPAPYVTLSAYQVTTNRYVNGELKETVPSLIQLLPEDGAPLNWSSDPYNNAPFVEAKLDDVTQEGNSALLTEAKQYTLDLYYANEYTVKYTWADAPAGVTLPTDTETYLGVDAAKAAVDKNYTNGYQFSGSDGFFYTFSGWDEGTVNGQVVTFTGSWTQGDKDPSKWYTLAYSWTGADKLSETLPSNPSSFFTPDEAKAAVDTTFTSGKKVTGSDGYFYTFSGWGEGTVNGQVVTFTGSWTQGDKDPSKWYTLAYSWTGADKLSETLPSNPSSFFTPDEAKAAVDTTFTSGKKVTGSDGYFYTFSGWGEGTVNGQVVTFTASWTKGEKDPSKWATVTFNSNGGSTVASQTVKYNDKAKEPTAPTKSGYTFAGWYTEEQLTTKYVFDTPVTGNITLYAKWNTNYVPYYPPVPPTVKIEDDDALGLNTTDHFAYIVGYGNGEVRPQNNITRAEVATIFFRLLTDDVRDENLTKTNRYSDVAATSWYNTAVSTLSSMGIITGYPDGTFRPNAAITRAEFAAIAARFDNDGDKTAAKFSDIATHWAKDEISIAYNNGWITGYPDGTFGPQRDITRAETMTLVNRVLNRQPETEEDLLPNMTVWTDNANPKAWYYLAVQEATNSHYYEFKTNSQYEKWTELRETRDWTQLEK